MNKRIIVITGCAGGLGQAMVRKFLREGDIVIATMRRASERADIFSDVQSTNLYIKELDLTASEDISTLSNWIKEKFNKVDLLINNAGYGIYGLYEDLTVNDLRNQFETNVFGTFDLSQQLLPLLKNGKLIVISSIIGRIPMAMASAYCASKYALEGLYETASFELDYHGIDVCLLGPGKFKTQFTSNLIFPEKYDQANRSFPYKELERNLHNVKSNRGAEPLIVANKAYALSLKKRMPLRVAVGNDAKIMTILEKILPFSIFHSLLGIAYRYALGVAKR